MMGKSQFALFFLCSFTLNIECGFALRCYGCNDLPLSYLGSGDTIPNNAPKCGSFGTEFDCVNGSCVKVLMTDGKSGEYV